MATATLKVFGQDVSIKIDQTTAVRIVCNIIDGYNPSAHEDVLADLKDSPEFRQQSFARALILQGTQGQVAPKTQHKGETAKAINQIARLCLSELN